MVTENMWRKRSIEDGQVLSWTLEWNFLHKLTCEFITSTTIYAGWCFSNLCTVRFNLICGSAMNWKCSSYGRQLAKCFFFVLMSMTSVPNGFFHPLSCWHLVQHWQHTLVNVSLTWNLEMVHLYWSSPISSHIYQHLLEGPLLRHIKMGIILALPS